jgi:putative hydrolase
VSFSFSNTELIVALARWAHAPQFGPRAQRALASAARRLLSEDSSIAGHAAGGTLTDLPRVGPFVARIIRELVDGTRPVQPSFETWPADARAAYEATENARRHFIALYDARSEVAAAGVGPARGDLQMHTAWSDGLGSLSAMIRAACTRGYDYIAITDHTQGLRIARGMPTDRLRRQRTLLARLNARTAVRVFAGAETNILPSGDLDMSRDDLAGTEIVLAGAHSALRTGADQTARLVAAVSHPSVHVLAHGRGRIFGVARGIDARWDEVFGAAAAHDTAIEINAYPDRQDIDYTMLSRAANSGCLIALGTDSHAPGQLRFMDVAIAHLVRAGVSAARVLNYRSATELEHWLGAKARIAV